jgi:molybdate transport system ATP-binding protein
LEVHVVRRVHASLNLDVHLRVGREIGVVFGPSGAGKTTLLRLIAGLSRPDAGHVRLEGMALFDSARRIREPLRLRRVGMIFQDDWLFPHLKASANIRFGLKGWPRDQADARLAEVAALCGVEHLLDRTPETLSGGERQRVGLARALAPRPRLLLCDEPVSALDLANRNALIQRLRDVQRTLAIPVLYVTHSPSEAIALGSRLFLLENGRIVKEGAPLDVLTASRNPFDGPISLEGVRNVFAARVVRHLPDRNATHLALFDRPVGTQLCVEVRADDILLASQPIGGVSARNQLAGTIERIVSHGPEAEALVRTAGLTWIVSLIAPAVEQLDLKRGSEVHLIIKARSCRVIG